MDEFWSHLGHDIVAKAQTTLQSREKLVAKQKMDVHDRRYQISNRINMLFGSSFVGENTLPEANACEDQMQEIFSANKPCEISQFLTNGAAAWYLHMLATQKVDITKLDYVIMPCLLTTRKFRSN